MQTLTISRISQVEAAAYPEFMCSLQDAASLEDVADYCECRPEQVYILSEETYYLLASEKRVVEVADVACLPNTTFPIFSVEPILRKRWAGKKIVADLREATSYRILPYLLRKGWKLLRDKPWAWENEVMHEVHLKAPSV